MNRIHAEPTNISKNHEPYSTSNLGGSRSALEAQQNHEEDILFHQQVDIHAQQDHNPIGNTQIQIKSSQRRKKLIILAIILATVLLMVGGFLLFHFLSQTSNEKTIQLPPNYSEFKEIISAGQENNLAQLIYIPKSQKIYEYNLINNQTTVRGDGTARSVITKITHQFAILCAAVTETQFELMLYILDTQHFENGKQTNQLSGFPSMLENEERAFRGEPTVDSSENDNKTEQTNEPKSDEYAKLQAATEEELQKQNGKLNSKEIDALAKNGISEMQFYHSRFPIIKLYVSKDSTLKNIFIPLNLRYDLLEIILNLIEQVTPMLSQDTYTIVAKGGDKRILKEKKRDFSERILSNEIVNKNLIAREDHQGDLVVSQDFEINKSPSDTSSQIVTYEQSSTIQNGALLESKANSDVSFSERKNDESRTNDEDEPEGVTIMKDILVKSEISIKFIRQDDNMKEDLFNQVLKTQSEMSALSYTKDQAIESFNRLFKASESVGEAYEDGSDTSSQEKNQSSITQENEQEKIDRRILAETKDESDMGKPIQKPIFRNSFASMTFGADIKSKCKQNKKSVKTEDVCTVGLYSFFNGKTAKVAEKQTKVNVSKILKYYQYIQNFLQSKLTLVNKGILGNLKSIMKGLNSILEGFENMLDVQKNPLLSEIYKMVYDDELEVFTLINTFESFLNKSVKALSDLVADPIETIKGKTLEFLTFQNDSIQNTLFQFEKLITSKLSALKDSVQKDKQLISNEQISDIKSLIDNMEDIIDVLIVKPVNKTFEDLETYTQEKANKLFKNTFIIEQNTKLEDPNDSKKETTEDPLKIQKDPKKNDNTKKTKQINLFKKVVSSTPIVDGLKSYLSQSQRKMNKMKQIIDDIIVKFKENVEAHCKDLNLELQSLNNPEAKGSSATTQALEEFNEIFNEHLDLSTGFIDLQEEIDEMCEMISNIQKKQTTNIISMIAQQFTGFPLDLLSKIKEQGVKTFKKAKNMLGNIQSNLTKWITDLKDNSKKLLTDIKEIYQSILALFNVPNFHTSGNDPNFYSVNIQIILISFFIFTTKIKTPLVSEVGNIVNSITELFTTEGIPIRETINRFIGLPQKFPPFIKDVKDLMKRTFNYFDDISLSVKGIYSQQQELWSTFGESSKEVAEDHNKGLKTQVTEQFENETNQQIGQLKDEASQTTGQLDQSKDEASGFNSEIMTIMRDQIKKMIQDADTSFSVNSPKLKLGFKYIVRYPTPVGILLKLNLYASWETYLYINVALKNATLQLVGGVDTKVLVGGEASASIEVAEIGGYAEGVFLHTSLEAILHLKVLEDFKGSIQLLAKFTPYDIRVGLYYKSILQAERLSCDTDRRRHRRLAWYSFFNDVADNIVRGVEQAVNCISSIDIELKRNDIIKPIHISGETYNKTLLQYEW